jgi:hypothetical protein
MIIYEVEMTNQADQDIENICKYIALDSIDNSISFIKKFQYKIKNTLSIFPEKHRKYKNGNVWCY